MENSFRLQCKRLVALCLLSLFSALFMAPAGRAQVSQCSLFLALSEIEQEAQRVVAAASQPASENLQADGLQLTAKINSLLASRPVYFVAEQHLERPDWAIDFLQSRAHIAMLYNQNKPEELLGAARKAGYTAFGRELAMLAALVPCIAGRGTDTGPESPRGAGQEGKGGAAPDYTKAPVGAVSKLARALASVSKYIAKNIRAIAPYLFFLAIFILVWAVIKYDSYRSSCRQRHICHVDVRLVGPRHSQSGCITDISRIGAGIHLAHPIKPQTMLLVTAGNWQQKARVIRVGEGFIGIRFKRKLKRIPADFMLTGKKKWVKRSAFRQ